MESFRALSFANESRDGSAKIALSRNRREVSTGVDRRIGDVEPGTVTVVRPLSFMARRRRSESALGGPPIGYGDTGYVPGDALTPDVSGYSPAPLCTVHGCTGSVPGI
jgi:hypothetical protein